MLYPLLSMQIVLENSKKKNSNISKTLQELDVLIPVKTWRNLFMYNCSYMQNFLYVGCASAQLLSVDEFNVLMSGCQSVTALVWIFTVLWNHRL